MRTPAEADVLLAIRDVSKSYGGVRALQGVSLDIVKGEIHALCGENGAGKSTLNKVLAGSCVPDSGEALLGGSKLHFGRVAAAEAAGVMIVHQESAAFPLMNAEDNVFAGHEPRRAGGLLLDRAESRRRTRELLATLGESFSTRKPLSELSVAQRQMVGIARALSRPCKLLILDEPTASLSSRETEQLFRIVRRLRDEGVAILYVSHRLDEVFELADRVTVLRDGVIVGTVPVAETDKAGLIQMMVGREVLSSTHEGAAPGEALLEVKGLCRSGAFQDVSLQVRSGEVVSLAGLVGAGRSEVAKALFGIEPADSGEIMVAGRRVGIRSPTDAIRFGISLVPEDRQHEGLALPMTVSQNLTLSVLGDLCRLGFLSAARENALAERLIRDLDIKAESAGVAIDTLSGGNQQKVMLGKWLAGAPRLLILDEPTRGVDVGAKAEVHRLIRELAGRGVAILMISSELPEVLSMADRVVVMREGRVSGELDRADATQERILALALPEGAGEERARPESESAAPPAARQPSGGGVSRDQSRTTGTWVGLLRQREFGVLLLILLTVVAVSIINPDFLRLNNISGSLVQVAPAMIVACAMTLVIVTREIDISVGSLSGLAAVTMGYMASADHLNRPVWEAVAVALGVGIGIGLLNGVLVAFGRVPSIIVTLGMLTVLRGVTQVMTGGDFIQHLPPGLRALGMGSWVGVPISIWVALATIAFTAVLATQTPLGRRIYAVGNSPGAAVLAGISPAKIRMFVFAFAGFLTAVSVLVGATQLSSIQSDTGKGFELMVVTCVVVGGTSIRGGRGTVFGSVLGVLLLGTVGTVLIFMKLSVKATYWEPAIQGVFILAAVLVDHLSTRRGATT